MLFSFVIPCYNSSKTIRKVVEMTALEMRVLGHNEFQFVLINDCSTDGGKTYHELRELARMYKYIKVIDLAINAGQHNATLAGLNYTNGDIIICMDDDLQTHPSQLKILLDEFDKGYDIVYGFYPKKKSNLFRNFGSWLNYITVRLLIGKPKELKTSSYWVIRGFVRDNAIKYDKPYTYLQGLFLKITYNISCVPINHFEREVGKSNYTFRKLIRLWSSIIGFSIVPLRMASYFGYFFACIGVIGALIVLIRRLTVPSIALGWSSVIFAICFFAGLILVFLGLIGEYIGRMYLSINKSPQYIVREIINE